MRAARKSFKLSIYFFTILSVVMLIVFVGFLITNSFSFFKTHSILEFLFSSEWDARDGNFGLFYILLANFFIAILACFISSFFAFGTTLFICFYAKGVLKIVLNWMIEILAGIPSIIYGFFGLFTIVKLIENGLSLSAGESVLAGSLILSIMILPFFTTHMIKSVNLAKDRFLKDSDSLGVSRGFFIRNIIIKEFFLATITGFILAFSRAVGETMAVMMVIGNTPLFPHILSKAQTIPSLIALEMGMSEVGSSHYYALIASGLVLFVFVALLNLLIFILENKTKKSENA